MFSRMFTPYGAIFHGRNVTKSAQTSEPLCIVNILYMPSSHVAYSHISLTTEPLHSDAIREVSGQIRMPCQIMDTNVITSVQSLAYDTDVLDLLT
jgi:hypothetical protein